MYEMTISRRVQELFQVIYWCAQMESSDLHLMEGIANLTRNRICYD